MSELQINSNFKSLIPPLSTEEFHQLEENCLKDGIIDPIRVWDGVIVDGHNRYEIAQRYELQFSTKDCKFDQEQDAINWIINNQLGRRNLTPEQMSYLRGKRYNGEKKSQGGTGSNQYKATEQRGQNATSAKKDSQLQSKTSEKLAKEYGVNESTIKRDGKYADAVDTIAELAGEETKNDILSGNASLPKRNVISIAEKAKESQEDARQILDEMVKKPHISNNSGNNEWYTPKNYIDAARATMGKIDIDPASSEIANKTVQATTYHTEETNGLNFDWEGKLWMNPPYAQPLINQFCEKLIIDLNKGTVTEACVLVNNATETKWFQSLMEKCTAICFPSSRIRFIDTDGKPSGAPLQGQAVLYFGDQVTKFVENFKQFGTVLYASR